MALTKITNGWRYTPDPDQMGYRPPEPRPQFEPPRVMAGTVTAQGTVVQQAHAAIVHARDEFRRHVERTREQRAHYTDEGFNHQISKFADTAAAKAVDAAVQQVRDCHLQAKTKVDELLSPSSAGDAAREMRNTRYWNRAKSVLDGAKEKYTPARELLKAADRDQLAVLAEELPAYMTANGQPTNWIPHTIGEVIPDYAEAKRQLDHAAAALAITEQNANFIRRGFSEGRPPVHLADPSKRDPDV